MRYAISLFFGNTDTLFLSVGVYVIEGRPFSADNSSSLTIQLKSTYKNIQKIESQKISL